MGTINIGIDVGKRSCVATAKGESRLVLFEDKFQRTTLGITSFTERVKREHPDREYKALVESTGNYWMRAHDVLEGIGVNTLVAHP